ncbi:MAG TPA: YigZ family protein [Pseudogracilibacillus sp.]|nr:YigZ family protein [Pseudogracilibacillus sp.]
MLPSYYTIKQSGSHEIIIQKSRFIGYVARVTTEEEAQAFIQSIKKKHFDATHNCSAYMIGDNNQIQKANDDGEPSGTAGVPMLEVLKRQDLKDTAVVVTRYFGGIKLGAGGLIRAYSTSTSEAIKHVGVVRRELMEVVSIKIEYPLLGKMENNLRSQQIPIETIHYLENVDIHVLVPVNEYDTFHEQIVEWTNDQASIEKLEQKYVELNVKSTKE